MDFAQASPPYTSEPSGTALLQTVENSCFKLYFLQIVGRAQRSRYEWSAAKRSREQTVAQLEALPLQGVGFACVFPHITKVFSFGSPEGNRETNLYVRAFGGDPLQSISLEYGGSMEVACAGEMEIAAKEFALWRRCASVGEYLEEFVDPAICTFEDHQKLKRYLQTNPA